MLTLWNPFVPVTRERSDSRMSTKTYFDRLFEDTFTSMLRDFSTPWPGVGIEQKKNEDGSLSIAVDIPGIKEENITVEVEDNVLHIKGERKTAASSYAVNKSVLIPEGYSAEDIKAELADGVLTLNLAAKPLPQKEIKKIPIVSSVKQLK